jgi:hypothetical protein
MIYILELLNQIKVRFINTKSGHESFDIDLDDADRDYIIACKQGI